MIKNKEKQILQFIKYAPAISTLLISSIITYFFLLDKNQTIQNDLNLLKNDYLQVNKQRVMQEVNRVYDYILFKKQNSEKLLKKSLKQNVIEAYNIIDGIYENNKHKSKEKILDKITNALSKVRFNDGRGYIFIHSLQGKNLFHPTQKHLENKNLWDLKDIKGKYIIRDMINSTNQTGEGYSEYYWYRPMVQENQYRKIGFYKIYKNLNILIGTSEYLDDFESNLKEDVLSYINSIRYGENGYIFVIDYNGKTLGHVNKKLRGLAFKDIKNPNQKKLIKNLIAIAKNSEGYSSYLGEYNNQREVVTEKISFVKGFEDWQWMIGSGFYQDELLADIKRKKEELLQRNNEEITRIIFISFVITLVLLLLSLYISTILRKHFAEFNEQNKILTQHSKMATMGEMIANIAHQWRQPLNMISISASSMKLNKQLGKNDTVLEMESIEHILNSTKHLSDTIEVFKNYFNPNKSKEYFCLKESISKLYDFTKYKLENNDINVILDLQEYKISSYENELIQALLNILNNSVDAFKENRSLKEKYIFITIKKSRKDESSVVLEVKDNAGGINENILPRIFEAYFTTKHQSQGTGIGLYMTYNIIINNLKASLDVKNVAYKYKGKFYKGVSFKIVLPQSI